MKKFFKMIAGLGVLDAIAGAVYYVYKNYLQDKEFDDLDEEDYGDDDDLNAESTSDSRGYVTLDLGGMDDAEGNSDDTTDTSVDASTGSADSNTEDGTETARNEDSGHPQDETAAE